MYIFFVSAESILENKEFLKITGDNSSVSFFISDDGDLHCIENYKGIKRHTKTKIIDYAKGRAVHIFIQKREVYMRLIAKAVI